MFQVSVEETFSAGHALRGYKGKCENVHGHNYRVRVTLEGPQLDSIGLLVDFTRLKQIVREIMGRLDHQFVNDQRKIWRSIFMMKWRAGCMICRRGRALRM